MKPESWTITDVVEHLAIAEPQYWQRVGDSMKQPANTEKLEATDAGDPVVRHRSHESDDDRRGAGADRQGADVARAARPLPASCARRCASTRPRRTDDLRSRKLLEGNMDVYQWFLMISTHSQRHILQIREIKADPKYPAS